jgi:catechol 2,3-dioxygenase-like lactoylglutathione lyase family enzyme
MAARHAQAASRRRFIKTAITVAATAAGTEAQAQSPGAIRGFDHVALPMLNSDAMLAFYRALGVQMTENANAVSMHFGQQMINFHRPALWQNQAFTLRAPAAKPPCGDLCFVWDGSPASLEAMLDRAGARVETGPVNRQGGRQKTGSSTYVRDPDGNLLEFIIYPA